ncbi:hypothetical protein HZH68_006233 [Vespula germanica]|uniref:Uncharacterized protein n=1 Tax=Vespula germanica TaxID=30212 RepID=A0A834KEP7_VESGE|nr:hypothetical protein HZH68_006233 [Vespula germanica]
MMQSSTSVARSTDDGYWENGNKEHASISALREWNGKALLYVHKRSGGKEEWKRSVSEERSTESVLSFYWCYHHLFVLPLAATAATAATAAAATAAAAKSDRQSPSAPRRLARLVEFVLGIEKYTYDTYKPSDEVQRTERTLFNFLAPSMQESSFMVPKSKSFEREQRTRWCFDCPVTHCTRKDRVHSQGS